VLSFCALQRHAQAALDVLRQHAERQRHRGDHRRARPRADAGRIRQAPVGLFEPLHADAHHLVEERRRRPLGQRPRQVVAVGAHGRDGIEPAQRPARGLLVQPVHDLHQVLVARLAQRLLGAEVVAHQAQGHARGLGDAPRP
jgi:hypothetical protein